MNLFMQGMRRSGTTIVFDILSQDPRFDVLYEPLSAGRVGALGGGSGVQIHDLMDMSRQAREKFLLENPNIAADMTTFNHGAPRDPSLELESTFPPVCLEYLQHFLRAEHNVIKFTRMYRKAHVLAALDPDAYVVLLVRDPRDVVASYLYARGQRRLHKYANRELFFNRTSNMNSWKVRQFSDAIADQENRPECRNVPNWLRPLIVWEYTFRHFHRDARELYGARFRILRHEDLCANPTAETLGLYEHLGIEPNQQAVNWAAQHVRGHSKECYSDDPRWSEAFERYGVTSTLQLAGYA
jgi:hypothetical protein